MTIKNNNRQKPRLDVFVVKTMQMKNHVWMYFGGYLRNRNDHV